MKLLLAFLCAASANTVTTHTATIKITGTINAPWKANSASDDNSLGGAATDGNVAKRTEYQKELCTALLKTTEFKTKFGSSTCTAVISKATGLTTPPVLDTAGSKVVFTLTGYKTSKTTAAEVKTEVEALWSTATLSLSITPANTQLTGVANVNAPTLAKATAWASSEAPVTATTTTKKSGAVEVCASISMIILGFMNVL
jgi:hypothetical protein